MKFALVILVSVLASVGFAQTPVSSTVTTVSSAHEWGYRWVKQSLGSYKQGRSVYQISQRISGTDGEAGWVLLVDEHAGTAGIFNVSRAVNPGGMASFADGGDGCIDLVEGNRAHEVPFDYWRSQVPYDASAWDLRLDGFVSSQGSTAVMFQAVGDVGLMMWREGHSAGVNTTLRFWQYDLTTTPPTPVFTTDVFKGWGTNLQNKRGIEQLMCRWDPREQKLAASVHFWAVQPRIFGPWPFAYTDDLGVTWRREHPGLPGVPHCLGCR